MKRVEPLRGTTRTALAGPLRSLSVCWADPQWNRPAGQGAGEFRSTSAATATSGAALSSRTRPVWCLSAPARRNSNEWRGALQQDQPSLVPLHSCTPQQQRVAQRSPACPAGRGGPTGLHARNGNKWRTAHLPVQRREAAAPVPTGSNGNKWRNSRGGGGRPKARSWEVEPLGSGVVLRLDK